MISEIRDAGGLDRTWSGLSDQSVPDTSLNVTRGGVPSPAPTAAPTPVPTTSDHVSVSASIDFNGVNPYNITEADYDAIKAGIAATMDGVEAENIDDMYW